MQIDEKVFVLGTVVAVLLGLGIGYLAFGFNQQKPDVKASLSEDDKNFLIQLASDQVNLSRVIALQAATFDWCTANGGQWVTYIEQQGPLPVSKDQADNLRNQGANVQQLPDGNFVVQALALQSNCILLPIGVKE